MNLKQAHVYNWFVQWYFTVKKTEIGKLLRMGDLQFLVL